MSVVNISKPTQEQTVHGIERSFLVFVLAVAAYLKTTNDPLSKAAISGAAFAGVTAVFQLVVSTFTTL